MNTMLNFNECCSYLAFYMAIFTLEQKHTREWLPLFALGCTVLSLVISLRYYHVHTQPESIIGVLFSIFHTVGHMGMLCFVMALPVVLVSRLIKKLNITILVAIVIATFWLGLLLADTYVYKQYRFHINAMVVELFIAGGSEVIAFSVQMWIEIIASLAVMLIAVVSIAIIATHLIRLKRVFLRTAYWIIPLCLVSANIIHIWADGRFIRDVTAQNRYLPLSVPATAKKLMAKYGLLDVEAHKQRAMLATKRQHSEIQYPLRHVNIPDNIDKMDVLLIVIDSWRADMMNPTVTPNIAQFAQQANQFSNHYSGSNNTRHGMFSMLYGLPGTYWPAMLQNKASPLLMDAFIQSGYQTQIYSSAKLTMPEFDQTLFVAVENLRTHSKGDTPWQRDIDATQDLLAQYSPDHPSFNVLFLDAAHGYSTPDNFNKPFSPSIDHVNYLDLDDDFDATPLLNQYKNALYFIDQQVGQVLSRIEYNLDNTIVIITGDHGQEFNENRKGYWGHNSNYSRYQTHVPLVIHWPNQAVIHSEQLTSHLDLVPTLMTHLFKVDNQPADYSSGKSLFEMNERDSILIGRDGYYAVQDRHYIYELDRLGNFSIFNQDYVSQDNAPLNTGAIQNAINEMSRFYQVQ